MSCFISFLPFLFNKRKIKTLRSLGLSGLVHSTIFLEFLLVKMLWNDLSQSNKFHEFWRIFSMSQVISQLLDELSWTKEEKSEQKTTVGGLGVFYFICICNNDKKKPFLICNPRTFPGVASSVHNVWKSSKMSNLQFFWQNSSKWSLQLIKVSRFFHDFYVYFPN